MLDIYIANLDEKLEKHGVLTNVILRTERSLYDEEETKEVELYFTESVEMEKTLATIHLFPLDQACEIETEISFTTSEDDPMDAQSLWERAKKIVEEISLTEKRRYISPNRPVETAVVLDFHFILPLPQNADEERAFQQTLERFAEDLGKLVRL